MLNFEGTQWAFRLIPPMNSFLLLPAAKVNLVVSAQPESCLAHVSRAVLAFLLLVLAETGLAQQLDPIPPANGLPVNKLMTLMRHRLHQPSPPPPGGFWVIEDQPAKKAPTIIRFYTDQLQLLKTDTLHNVRLDIRRRAVVDRLNERLLDLLPTSPADRLATSQVTH